MFTAKLVALSGEVDATDERAAVARIFAITPIDEDGVHKGAAILGIRIGWGHNFDFAVAVQVASGNAHEHPGRGAKRTTAASGSIVPPFSDGQVRCGLRRVGLEGVDAQAGVVVDAHHMRPISQTAVVEGEWLFAVGIGEIGRSHQYAINKQITVTDIVAGHAQ